MTQIIDPSHVSGMPNQDLSQGVGSLDDSSLEELRSQGLDTVEQIKNPAQVRDIFDALDSGDVTTPSSGRGVASPWMVLILSNYMRRLYY